MSDVRVRQDIWDLGDERDPWRDPIILAYAEGIIAMQDAADDDPRSWVNQSAIHERDSPPVPGRLENQCQHGCWFFLPWHRMYLYRFEQIIQSHLDADTAETWALPYWNYSDDPDRRVLPPAFRQSQLPDGRPNPLFTRLRQQAPVNINRGRPMPAQAVRLVEAMAPTEFALASLGTVPGFGGGPTRPLFHHSASGPFGPLEATPHGAVHNQVGGATGLMSAFSTAALDPIFWLHHSNIDRLWEVWRRQNPPRLNPDNPDWLTMKFPLPDATGARVTMECSEVVEIEAQLSYTYSGLPPAPPPAEAPPQEMRAMADEQPAEMIGAIEEPVTLAGASPASTSLTLDTPSRAPADFFERAQSSSVYLNVEDVEGEANPGLLYGVYVNLPPGETADPDSPHYAGAISFFGIESAAPSEGEETDEEAPHRLRYVFDITDKVAALSEQGKWNPDELNVTFSPIGVEGEDSLEATPPPVQIGRVSLFVQ